MKDIKGKCNLIVDLLKYTYNEKILNRGVAKLCPLLIKNNYSLRLTFFVLYSILRCSKILSCF